MASYLLQLNPLSRKVLPEFYRCNIVFTRNTSETYNPETWVIRKGKYGVKRQDGQIVNNSETLVRQKNLTACPGLNTKIVNSGDIFAKATGKVFVTYEKTNFTHDHFVVNLTYPDSLPKYKTYFNVVPLKQHQRFKLIETI